MKNENDDLCTPICTMDGTIIRSCVQKRSIDNQTDGPHLIQITE